MRLACRVGAIGDRRSAIRTGPLRARLAGFPDRRSLIAFSYLALPLHYRANE
jgi:hypothetical protein